MFMQHFTLNLFELVYYCYDVVVLCPFGNLASRNSMFANVCMMNSFNRAQRSSMEHEPIVRFKSFTRLLTRSTQGVVLLFAATRLNRQVSRRLT
jgi:hypothetical protein